MVAEPVNLVMQECCILRYGKEKELVDTFVPIGFEEDERRIKDLNTKAEEERSSIKDVDSTNKEKEQVLGMKRSSWKSKRLLLILSEKLDDLTRLVLLVEDFAAAEVLKNLLQVVSAVRVNINTVFSISVPEPSVWLD
ncbi:hypothetical protein Tco_1265778 [Tanacetum coccineum]